MEQQEGEGRGGGELGPQPSPQPPPQQQHHCPRCESLNTKFCYYNNYSLSQPRYFCKACKRYWTQGGTLRNIPIGGASRKGKHSKNSSSSTMNSSRSQLQSQPQPQLHLQPQPQSQLQPRPQLQLHLQSQLHLQPQSLLQLQLQPQLAIQELVQNQPNMTTLMRHIPPTVVQSTSPYYQGGGVGGNLSSLSPNPSSQPFNQFLNIGVGDVVASSNSGLLSGFNNPASLGSQHHRLSQIRPSLFNQIGNRDREVEYSLLRAEQGYNIPSSMASSSAASHSDHWPQSFINNANDSASDSSLWSTISTTSIGGNTQNNIRGGSSSLTENHWPNLPGYNGSPDQ